MGAERPQQEHKAQSAATTSSFTLSLPRTHSPKAIHRCHAFRVPSETEIAFPQALIHLQMRRETKSRNCCSFLPRNTQHKECCNMGWVLSVEPVRNKLQWSLTLLIDWDSRMNTDGADVDGYGQFSLFSIDVFNVLIKFTYVKTEQWGQMKQRKFSYSM